MPDIYTLVLLFSFGCLGGFLAGLLGVGGGIVFIPLLTYYFSSLGITDPDLTKAFLANSFFAIIFSGISGSIKQYNLGQFYPKQVLYTSVAAIVASLFVSMLISMGDWYNKERFTMFFIIVLVFLNVRLFIHRKKETSISIKTLNLNKFLIIGLITGAFAALSGLGGGFIMVMLFVQWLHIDIKHATAVSTGTIPFISIPLVLYYMVHQPLHFPLNVFHIGHIVLYGMLPVIAGVIIITPFGVQLASKLKATTIKLIFIGFSAIIILKMLIEIL